MQKEGATISLGNGFEVLLEEQALLTSLINCFVMPPVITGMGLMTNKKYYNRDRNNSAGD